MLILDTVGSERFAVSWPRRKSSMTMSPRRIEGGAAALSRSRPSQKTDPDPPCFHSYNSPLAERREWPPFGSDTSANTLAVRYCSSLLRATTSSWSNARVSTPLFRAAASCQTTG